MSTDLTLIKVTDRERQFPVHLDNFAGMLDMRKENFVRYLTGERGNLGYVEGIDYLKVKEETKDKGSPNVEYRLTYRTAREIAMVSKSDKAHQVRREMMDHEQAALRDMVLMAMDKRLSGMYDELDRDRKYFMERFEKIGERLDKAEAAIDDGATQEALTIMGRIADAIGGVVGSRGEPEYHTLAEAACVLASEGIHVGRQRLVNRLLERQMLYRTAAGKLMPMAEEVEMDTLRYVSTERGNQIVVTAKGMVVARKIFQEKS